MNWLIAPVFASTGRVVTQSPLEQSSVAGDKLSIRKKILKGDFHSLLLLSTHCRSGLHLRVTPNRRSHSRSARHAESLIEQALFQRGQEQQHERLLAAVAHQSHAPDFSLHQPESSGDFDIELVEQLIADVRVVNAAGNHHRRDRWQDRKSTRLNSSPTS